MTDWHNWGPLGGIVDLHVMTDKIVFFCFFDYHETCLNLGI